MERRAGRVIAVIAFAAASLQVAGRAAAQCANDAGNGDHDEGEMCQPGLIGPTTDGCNLVPYAFDELSAADFAGDGSAVICGTSSTYNGARDTDWHRISFAALDAADADNNGVVQISSHIVSEFESVTFFVSIGNPTCAAVTVLSIGCGGPQGSVEAVETVTISEHPNGIVVFVAPGLCSGAGIFHGNECTTGLNDYLLTITFSEPPTACGDPDLGPCNTPSAVPGCEDPVCCEQVCASLPLCCALEWSQPCAEMAISLGCAPPPAAPVCIANGTDIAADGYLQVCPDPLGAWADLTFGGQGDRYNPAGALAAQAVSFANAFFMYRPEAQQRELFSNNPGWAGTPPVVTDLSLSWEVLCVEPGPYCAPGSVASDTNNDGVFDRLVSRFGVTGAEVDLTFDLMQEIDLTSPPTPPVAVLTQTYTIHNNLDSPIDFVLLRQVDFDLVWAGGFGNDSVGTGTNGSPLERFVFQGEAGQPASHITMSSPQGAQYVGAKSGVDPDGPGPGPAIGAGTDTQEWDAYGVPEGWGNFIAYVGYDTNGSSGAQPGDAHVDLEIPVSIVAYATTVVTFNVTYGAMTPLGFGPCPWDCAIPPEGEVNVLDFLAILAQWGQVGAACDINGGGVSITDFLGLLGHWGACPP